MAIDPQNKLQFPTYDEKPAEMPASVTSNGNTDKDDPNAIDIGPLPELPPIVDVEGVIPERIEDFIPPAPYDRIKIRAWTNPTGDIIDALVKRKTSVRNYYAFFIREWNLKDRSGTPLKICGDSFNMFPDDLFGWYMEEWITRRNLPLVPKKNQTQGDSSV